MPKNFYFNASWDFVCRLKMETTFAISFQKTENRMRQPANFLANGPASPLGLAEWNALNQRASLYTHNWMRYTNEPLYTITAARVRAAAVIYAIKT